MSFRLDAGAGGEDVLQRHDDLSIVIPAGGLDKLVGATLDFTGAGMVMQNPNRPSAAPPLADRPPADLSGELPQRVLTVLEEQINPQIASHGGRADLVAVEDGIAYLRLSGGGHGCGLASVPLSQGI